MKRAAGLFASFAVVALLIARPGLASADVVPARKAKADRDAAKVEQRLARIGVDSSGAKASAEKLTPGELRYFASDPSRLQNVGGITWDEFLGGVIVGGVVAAAVFLIADHSLQ
jgi:hypothetical protein